MSKQTSNPHNIMSFTGIVLGSALTGVISAAAGGFLGVRLMTNDIGGFGDLIGAIMGVVIGYPIGVVLGLVAARRLFHVRGSLMLGAFGAIFGAAAIMLLAEPLNLNMNQNLLFGSILAASPLLGTAGFRLRRGGK